MRGEVPYAPDCGGKLCMRCRRCLVSIRDQAKNINAPASRLVFPSADIPLIDRAREDVVQVAANLVSIVAAFRKEFGSEPLGNQLAGNVVDAVLGPVRAAAMKEVYALGLAAKKARDEAKTKEVAGLLDGTPLADHVLPVVGNTRPKRPSNAKKRKRRR